MKNTFYFIYKAFFVREICIFFYFFPFHIFQTQTQRAITCSKLTIETLEQRVKYVQS